MTRTRTTARNALLLLAATAVPVVAGVPAPSPASAAPGCATRWGSLPEQVLTGSTGRVTGVRAGRHACFDRIVLDVAGDLDGYAVRYVRQVRHDGSGEVVPLRGGARLQVTATAPVVPTDSWFRADGRIVDTTGYRTLRDVAFAGSFEGSSAVGVGVRARLPFRVLLLDGPGDRSRLVVDVAHRW